MGSLGKTRAAMNSPHGTEANRRQVAMPSASIGETNHVIFAA